ncbi:Para-hydroxybenzoate--polyprenyltransferase, mitochondrial precursor (PHB:polyprenyltransferase) [Podila minutissima]|uniref:4-hydroxybenzoate polyprenyltransferase, mitochondrial n=1 Tax=Podila minutissima TaxID=64525 RepID=A0A9P5SPQ9_9FUNG|nr:Para-hydroxybenzoate--polyprenyltransferase, mitochondrial precursor (PHB:polyprenyltransferase) [Podila minutissima]
MITCTTGTLFPGCTRLLARASLGNRSVAHHGLMLSMSHTMPTMGSGSTTGANFTSFRHHFSFLASSKQISRLQPSIRFHKLISPSSAPSHSQWVKSSSILSRATAHKFSSSTPSSTTSTSDPVPPTNAPTSLQPGTWLDRMPKSIQPYLYLTRIDKPIGTWLLLWPCIWSITMASYGANLSVGPTAYMIGLFATGAVIMRGAGCTINDLWDRNIDNKVERTKVRPLASGAVSPAQAVAFLGLQLSAGLAVLCQMNLYSIMLGASSLSLVVSYPAMKRITYWPQVVLGLAFNWGALLGSSAMLGATNWSVALPLYASGVCWTLVYDTIYAHQDKKDDLKIGVKSTALRFGEQTPTYLAAFSTGMVSMLALSGYMNDQGPLFYALSVGGAAAHLAWQLRTVNYDNPADCWSKFASNKWTGALVFSGIASDYVYHML